MITIQQAQEYAAGKLTAWGYNAVIGEVTESFDAPDVYALDVYFIYEDEAGNISDGVFTCWTQEDGTIYGEW